MSASQVRIRFGSAIAEKTDNAYFTLPTKAGMTASQLRSELSARYPEAAPLLKSALIFANGSALDETDPIPEGEIVVLNAVAGG